jgi:hypothetical protein
VLLAYYAHLAAGHCRNFVENDGSGSDTSSIIGNPDREVPPLPALHQEIRIHLKPLKGGDATAS